MHKKANRQIFKEQLNQGGPRFDEKAPTNPPSQRGYLRAKILLQTRWLKFFVIISFSHLLLREILCLISPERLMIQISQNLRLDEQMILYKLAGGITSNGRIEVFS